MKNRRFRWNRSLFSLALSGAFSGASSVASSVAPVAILAGLCVSASAGDPFYTLVNQETGIHAVTIPALGFTGQQDRTAGGMSVGDFNNDGWPDLFIAGLGTVADMLYINQQDGTFVDEAELYGIAYKHYGFGSAVGDVNNDGLPDMYVVSFGPSGVQATVGKNLLYINNGPDKNGQYSFSEQAEERGVNDVYTIVGGKGACFGDIDLDGDLDLYVATWGFTPGGNRIFENDGSGHFENITDEAIPDTGIVIRGFTPKLVDVTGDRYPDLLLTADFTTSHLLVNNGPDKNGRVSFRDVTEEAGINTDHNGMGSTVNDFNGDGILDWFQTNIYTETANYFNTLFMGIGNNDAENPVFLDQATSRGVADNGWGWGVVSGDYDNDGDIDMIATNGWPSWVNESTRYWKNDGTGQFGDLAFLTGLDFHINGRGVIQFDYDKDGDLDLAFIDNGGPFRIYRNNRGIEEFARYLRIHLNTDLHPCLAPMGYGTRIIATYDGKEHLRVVDGASSYLSQSELEIHFGLAGLDQVDELRVEWADGSVTTMFDVAADQEITITAIHPFDLTQDGEFNYFDISELISAYMSGDMRADVNSDGVVDMMDIMAFFAGFKSPCS